MGQFPGEVDELIIPSLSNNHDIFDVHLAVAPLQLTSDLTDTQCGLNEPRMGGVLIAGDFLENTFDVDSIVKALMVETGRLECW